MRFLFDFIGNLTRYPKVNNGDGSKEILFHLSISFFFRLHSYRESEECFFVLVILLFLQNHHPSYSKSQIAIGGFSD